VGFSHAFVATKDIGKADLLERLGLTETGEDGDVDVFLNGYGLTQLPNGWLVVACNNYGFPARAPLAALSELGMVVSCAIDERVMASEARGFAGGREVWSVAHDGGDKGAFDLEVAGAPPNGFVGLRDKTFAEQEAEDTAGARVDVVFDLPPRLAESLCGFFIGETEGDFVELRAPRRGGSPGSSKPGFFRRLFGGR